MEIFLLILNVVLFHGAVYRGCKCKYPSKQRKAVLYLLPTISDLSLDGKFQTAFLY